MNGGPAPHTASGPVCGPHSYALPGEESAQQLTLDQIYDELRAGTRLILHYDAERNAFLGTVMNVSDTTLDQVRVEVHLSNGIELGPTPPIDLVPGQEENIEMPAGEQPFTTWSAHAEVGSAQVEAGSEGQESGGEHGSEGQGADSGEKSGN